MPFPIDRGAVLRRTPHYASGDMRRAGSHGGDPAPSEGTLYSPSARSRWRRIKVKRGCEEMNSHFFTAPFYFAFIWFRVQGSGVRWRLRRLILEDGILVSQPSPLGNAIKLSGRTFLAPHRGSCPKGLCKRTGFLGVKRRENPVRRHFERSEMRGLRSGIA